MCVYTVGGGYWGNYHSVPGRVVQDIKRTTHKSPRFPLMGAHIFAIGFFFCWVFESLYVVRFFFLFSTFFLPSPFRCTVCKFLWLFRQRRGDRSAVRTIFSLSLFVCWNVSVFSHTRARERRRRTSSWRPPSAAERQGVASSPRTS